MEPFETVILTLNEPNLNNRVYSTAVVQEAIDKHNASERGLFGGNIDDVAFPLSDISKLSHRITNLRIDGNAVYGTITPAYLRNWQKIEPMVVAGVGGFRISCTCDIAKRDDGMVEISNMTICSVDYCNNPA